MNAPDQVLNILALTVVPFTPYEMEQYLVSLCKLKNAATTIKGLLKNRTLIEVSSSKSYRTSERYSMNTILRLRLLDKLASETADVRNHLLSLVSSQHKYNYLMVYGQDNSLLRNDLLRALLFPGVTGEPYIPSKLGHESDDLLMEPDAAMMATLYAIIVDKMLSSRYESLLQHLPFEVLYKFSDMIDEDCKTEGKSYNYDRIAELIDNDVALNQNDKNYLHELYSWPLHLFRDDFSNLGFDEQNATTCYGYSTLAVKAMEEDDANRAEKLFRLALRCNNNKLFGNSLVNLMLVSAFKMSGSSLALKSLESYRKKNVFGGSCGDFATNILLFSFTQDIDESNWDKLDDYFRIVGYTSRMVFGMVSRKMEAPQSSIPSITSFINSKLYSKASAIFQRGDLIPFVHAEKWEKALSNVMVRLGYDKSQPESRSSKIQGQNRIIYMVGSNGNSIQPVLQKSKDGITWSKGRNIALKTFFEGIPEMSDLDRSMAMQVRVSSHYYGAKYYELGGIAPMALLAGHSDVYKIENPDIRINVVEDPPYLAIETSKDGIRFKSNVRIDYLSSNVQVIKETDILYKVTKVNSRQKEIIEYLTNVLFPLTAKSQLKDLLGFIGKDIVVHSDADEIQSACETVPASSILTLVLQPEDDGLKVNVYVKPFVTEAPYLSPGEGARIVMSSLEGKPVRTTRNFKEEKENLSLFMDIAADILGDASEDTSYHVQGAQNCLDLVETIRSMGEVRVEWPEGCKYRISSACDLKDLNITVKSGVNWFEMTGELKISEERIYSIAKLLSLFSSSEGRFIKVGEDEFIALSEKLRQQIASLSAYVQKGKGEKLGIPFVSAPVLGELRDSGVGISFDEASAKLLNSIQQTEDAIFEIPRLLQAELRPYQEDGFQWLCRLASWGAGACLADDMGLGKTVQAIALLLHRVQSGPALVVAPTSVAPNWIREIMRFAPSLQVLALNDMSVDERKQALSNTTTFDVVLSTYGVLLSQIDDIASVEWGTTVLDEAHVIKNRDTKSSSACMRIRSQFRMILTGTPLQNNLGELWNLFQFINPGYLGSFQHFNETFLIPIQERSNKERQAQLKKMVLPFLLRRTKSDVLDELPPKTEQFIYVDMDDVQTTVYESIRREAELSVEEHRMNLVQTLSEITKLRMAACSPHLVKNTLPRQSAKTEEIAGLLQSLVNGGHKALVFSQFTSFLDIIREVLNAKNLDYLYLDGSTAIVKRQKLIRDFQTGVVPIFLISLKAGGLGLNLTAADYIIHADPWWNPAIEDQASDRAYRIGQSRPVTVYHILSKNSIEEKILDLHRNKRSLADALLEGTDISSKLTREEILKLL